MESFGTPDPLRQPDARNQTLGKGKNTTGGEGTGLNAKQTGHGHRLNRNQCICTLLGEGEIGQSILPTPRNTRWPSAGVCSTPYGIRGWGTARAETLTLQGIVAVFARISDFSKKFHQKFPEIGLPARASASECHRTWLSSFEKNASMSKSSQILKRFLAKGLWGKLINLNLTTADAC